MNQDHIYYPDFKTVCRECGTSPCVLVSWHKQPQTELCGSCFFDEIKMSDWEVWNDNSELTETEVEEDE